MGQTSLPSEVEEPPKPICAWCGEPGFHTIIIQPAKYKWIVMPDGSKKKILKKRAITAQACGYHRKNLKMND